MFIIIFSLIAYLMEIEKLISFDSLIIAFVQGFETEFLTAIMKFFSFIGSTVSVIIISIGSALYLYYVLRHRRELILLAITMIGSTLLNILLKSIFQRARPEINQIVFEEGFSFPSGHSMAAFSLYGILTFLLWRHIKTRIGRGLLLTINSLMILLIGLSRIYLGVHYPSDVIAAYAASGFWLFTVIWFFQWVQERRHNTTQAS
ncbi:phosphatase PAP2 family protein [Robertmurraya andreesenii]|nr:phosphatase PAP2 family protein [Robertmurraya andreesenii]